MPRKYDIQKLHEVIHYKLSLIVLCIQAVPIHLRELLRLPSSGQR